MALDPWREFLWSLLLGWWGGLLYDLCCLISRQVRKRRRLRSRAVGDALFWLLFTATLAAFLFLGLTKELRFYLFLGMALGLIFYLRFCRRLLPGSRRGKV
ncbi:Spore cortex biosynthesis protein, YabQ-like protein [Ammonifex degensii KC4]|uniref:Spore cortex biosynthesis protein, YabQ-like protein n=1 Tax=Ammonifex degensii (strain DSM 10501 / KC4) TaxID=429009 RepID=C9RA15_AMMDK|nr:Spore cortex biosynthesis protein, YabQ-like protein [Ammonifex degensii KC4]